MKRFALLLFIALPLLAQQPQDDPLARYLVPPDLIMAHSQELNLADKQRAAIKSEGDDQVRDGLREVLRRVESVE